VGDEIVVEKLVYGGEGLGRLAGRVVLAPFVLPGETVEIESVRETKGLIHARVTRLGQQAEDRTTPQCPLFELCGGCHYQHIPYPRQLDFKRDILVETLARVGKIQWEREIKILPAEPWGYRNRTQFRILKRGRKTSVGFLEARSRRLVEAESCPINSPTLNRVHRALLEMGTQRRFPSFLRAVELFTNESDVQLNVLESERPLSKAFFDWCAEAIEGFSKTDAIDYPVGGDRLRVGSRSFFQVNRFLIEDLVREAVGDVAGAKALDLYSGVGLFTLPLARRFERVVAVDTSPRATRDLHFNLQRAALEARSVNLNVSQYLASETGPIDFAVADPPRAGLGGAVTSELLRLRPARLALVSCDPSTLARDLAALRGGGFSIDAITLIDLFPQTFHIETVVHLSA
jgi:23S rRNA (uracil1939-C5)-methyltransferase